MPAAKITKKDKKAKASKRTRPSRRQLEEDLGKLESLDRAIQEHQKAQFYGQADAQLDSHTQEKQNKLKHERSLRALANLTNVDKASKLSRQARSARDLQALDGVMQTLSKMDFASYRGDSTEDCPVSAIADEHEIDI